MYQNQLIFKYTFYSRTEIKTNLYQESSLLNCKYNCPTAELFSSPKQQKFSCISLNIHHNEKCFK
jgi:hypothetical protein